MLDTSIGQKIYLSTMPCDMRKSIEGLTAIVKLKFKLDPFADCLYVFCNKKGDKIKCLRWQNNGWWLYYRKLSKGTFKWKFDENRIVITVSEREFRWLLDGLSMNQPEAHKEVKQRILI